MAQNSLWSHSRVIPETQIPILKTWGRSQAFAHLLSQAAALGH